jgi:hypothetical protein
MKKPAGSGAGWLENHPRLMKADYVINEGGGVGMVVGRGMCIPARPPKRNLLAGINLRENPAMRPFPR